ncbi:MAG: CpsD/CapB family tyrosine-protein kinase [Desulfonauticus sp.]|nr:CpsD/CapB family tyrosine-protein kinase [Desulfonauticus sp.]
MMQPKPPSSFFGPVEKKRRNVTGYPNYGIPKEDKKEWKLQQETEQAYINQTKIKEDNFGTSSNDLILKIRSCHKDLIKESKLPRLSTNAENILASNHRYFFSAEGNLKSVIPDGKSLYITSCFSKEGKTTAAISLAYTLSIFSNRKVLLVDAHFSSPIIYRLFNVKEGISFRRVLSDTSLLVEGILPTFYENLYILPSMSAKNDTAGVNSTLVYNFLQKVSPFFDYILFDGRSILSAPEPVIFASSVDAVIFVVESERTKWEVLQSAVEKVVKIKARVAGVVLNKRKFYIPPAVYKIL